ncbi:MAG: DUF615 domain-containing protein [Burkholderiales bacterium]|nr:DUF615 domain-containing protein [Burkholderiales bacterium]MDR4516239.1 DUF615 domain-containing protein [Nitrosomonas sp.]
MQNDSNEAQEYDSKPSKTQRKKTMHDLQKMGEQLVELNDKALEELELPEMLIDAIRETRLITKYGARKRQMQFIGKLMRQIDSVPIQEKLETWQQRSLNQNVLLHQTERWRERILADTDALTEFARTYPIADIQHIRVLARNTLKERNADKPSKSYRMLFQALQKVLLEQTNDGD